VRHAEDLRSPDGPDRFLTEAGHQREKGLATLLKDVGINEVFTSSLQRTIKTAEPLAKVLQIESTLLPQLTTKLGCLIRALHFRNMGHPVSAVVL
jgi:broad specificity phosphatase PhoE